MQQAVPLSQVSSGKEVILAAIEGGQQLKRRVADMGLHIGSRVSVVNNVFHGPCLIEVNQMRLMLGRGMVEKILVQEAG